MVLLLYFISNLTTPQFRSYTKSNRSIPTTKIVTRDFVYFPICNDTVEIIEIFIRAFK
jgi:hypothetical protein